MLRRLFWKIFFSFWLVMILVIVTNLAVTWVQANHFEQFVDEDHVANLANRAMDKYQSEGIYGYNKWRKKMFHKKELRMLLLDSMNHDVTGRPLPDFLMAFLDGRIHSFRREFYDRDGDYRYDDYRERMDDDDHKEHKPKWFRRFERPVVWQVSDKAGKPYTFVLLNPRELSDHLFAKSTVLWRIGISTLVVVIISLLLSLYLVRPIRQLQATSNALAEGDLGARVSNELNYRKDELGELSKDFDAMAEKIEQLIRGQQDMLRDVSHELRTPLARLRIALEIARKRSGDSEELDRMELEAERINALIDDILQLVRLNNASYTVNKQPLELCELLQTLAADANLTAERVIIDCQPPVRLNTDPKLLSRVIENILQNALKYSEKRIDLTVHSLRPGFCTIIISDQGPGVDEEQLPYLFDPFYRTDAARGRQTGGYGLGLAIAAQSIKTLGGDISAENRPEGGLRVSIAVPFSETK